VCVCVCVCAKAGRPAGRQAGRTSMEEKLPHMAMAELLHGEFMVAGEGRR
jgi:hypothetical protein